jgi:hypothetical protein
MVILSCHRRLIFSSFEANEQRFIIEWIFISVKGDFGIPTVAYYFFKVLCSILIFMGWNQQQPHKKNLK